MHRLIPIYLFSIFILYSGVLAQSYEVKFDSINTAAWFGGDDRSNIGPRHVGVGQSVTIDTSITLERFAFYFYGPFDYAESPEGKGHEVTLTLNVRDSLGNILKTRQVVLPDTFTAGWVSWDSLNLDIEAPTVLIFTTYLVGAYDSLQVRGSIAADGNTGYDGGFRYGKHGTSDADMENWDNWTQLTSWDYAFWLTGTVREVTNIHTPIPVEAQTFVLYPNFPNPFNPGTMISYSLPTTGTVELTIFNTLGERVRTLVHSRTQSAGEHRVYWDGRDDTGKVVSSGTYIYRLRVGNTVLNRSMQLLK